MLWKNDRERSQVLKGIAVGVAAGAFLPDQFNPIALLRRVMGQG